VRSRRTPAPPSWLSVVERASAGFTGTARLAADEPVPATETPFRGPGYALTAEIEADQTLFGSSPDHVVVLHGQTSRAPEQRLDPLGDRFPPDSLRGVPYWDQARADDPSPVLCLLSDPPVVRSLLGPDDDLPQAVRTIRDWTESENGEAEIEKRLSEAGKQPAVCYVAGFELSTRTTSDLPGLVERFLLLPGRPGAAARGILQLLHPMTGQLSDEAIDDLARKLLHIMVDERDPEALVAYLSWFDAHRERIAKASPGVAADVRSEAERIAARSFSGPDADAWSHEVARFAHAVTDGGGS